MHLAFFCWDERSTCRVLAGWHTRRRSGSSTSGLLSFSHFNCEGMISWKNSKFLFFHFWSEVRGDVRFYTRPVTVENNGFARENRSHWSTVETFVMFSGKCFLVLRTVWFIIQHYYFLVRIFFMERFLFIIEQFTFLEYLNFSLEYFGLCSQLYPQLPDRIISFRTYNVEINQQMELQIGIQHT